MWLRGGHVAQISQRERYWVRDQTVHLQLPIPKLTCPVFLESDSQRPRLGWQTDPARSCSEEIHAPARGPLPGAVPRRSTFLLDRRPCPHPAGSGHIGSPVSRQPQLPATPATPVNRFRRVNRFMSFSLTPLIMARIRAQKTVPHHHHYVSDDKQHRPDRKDEMQGACRLRGRLTKSHSWEKAAVKAGDMASPVQIRSGNRQKITSR